MKSCGKEEDWELFIKLCMQLKTKKQHLEFFDFFLTAEERSALGLRIALIKELLQEQKTQREIAAELKTSIAKITRGSNCLKTISDGLKRFLKRYLLSS
ncbi:MAG: trp operon repressor [Pseudomonadota bacterium]